MPIYELQCVYCKTINELIIGLSEMPKTNDKREVDLKILGIKCKKCKRTKFKKLVSSHGKMASNWAAWQSSPPKAKMTK